MAFQEEELKTLENEARRCVILAIKARDVINFEELLELSAINKLQGANQEVLDFLGLFINTNAKDFSVQMSKF